MLTISFICYLFTCSVYENFILSYLFFLVCHLSSSWFIILQPTLICALRLCFISTYFRQEFLSFQNHLFKIFLLIFDINTDNNSCLVTEQKKRTLFCHLFICWIISMLSYILHNNLTQRSFTYIVKNKAFHVYYSSCRSWFVHSWYFCVQ